MQFSGWIGRALAGAALVLAATAVAAHDGIVEKKTFTLASNTTVGRISSTT